MTTYADATKGFQKILCNNIQEIDDYLFEGMTSNFYDYWDDNEPHHQADSDNYEYPDIYQFFLTDLTDSEVNYRVNRFNLLFMKSEKLDLWVLCVPHCGTMWDHVEWTDRKE